MADQVASLGCGKDRKVSPDRRCQRCPREPSLGSGPVDWASLGTNRVRPCFL